MKANRAAVVLAAMTVLALALAFSLAACGDNGDGEKPAPTAAQTPEATGETSTLDIYSTEWAITGEDGADIPNVAAGEITFESRNDGQLPHELAVLKTDLDAAELPVSAGIVNEAEAGELIGRTAYISGGDSEDLTLTLEAGNYVLFCNIVAHYEQGTFAPLVVE